MNKYDVFISYRRLGGKEKARPLKSELEKKGYKVFLDFDDLKDSVFDKRIMDAIDEAPIFLIILSEHSLDRCKNEDDWVRKEIEYANERKKHFVPVNPDKEFKGFPDGTPESVRECLGQHQFSSIDFEQLFIPSVDMMVKDRIEPIISGLKTAMNEKKGAIVRIETDLDCRILRFKEEIALAKADDITEIRLPKGKHKLTFEGVENKADSYSIVHEVKDIEYEDYIEVSLLEKYNARKAEEAKAEQDRLERERQKRFEQEQRLESEKREAEERKRKEAEAKAKEERLEREKSKNNSNTINCHEYVDLGLPSGLKWATCNVGASRSEDYGDYFAWGETKPKSEYTKWNSKTDDKIMNDINGNAQYDAGTANWGGNWRMPTKDEMQELVYYCTWKWTTQNGVKGQKVTGPNGNSIFLPAAGFRNWSALHFVGSGGYYWSSTPYNSICAYRLNSNSDWQIMDYYRRLNGLSVRLVAE